MTNGYVCTGINVLTALEAIRKRPYMYISQDAPDVALIIELLYGLSELKTNPRIAGHVNGQGKGTALIAGYFIPIHRVSAEFAGVNRPFQELLVPGPNHLPIFAALCSWLEVERVASDGSSSVIQRFEEGLPKLDLRPDTDVLPDLDDPKSQLHTGLAFQLDLKLLRLEKMELGSDVFKQRFADYVPPRGVTPPQATFEYSPAASELQFLVDHT